jgi:hypothetical protein
VRFHTPALLTTLTLFISCQEPVVVRNTFLLEAAGGTYVQQIGANAKDVTLGTSMVIKIRSTLGELPGADAQVSIQGPSTWNNDQLVKFTYPAKGYWVVAPKVNSKPLPGDYTVSAISNGVKVEKKIKLSENLESLPITTITAKLEGETPEQSVNASWEAVPNAVGYYARVWDGTKGLAVSDDAFTLEPKAVLPVDLLSPTHAYFVIVVASTLDTVAKQPLVPSTFLASDSIAELRINSLNAKINGITKQIQRNGVLIRKK